MLDDANVFHGHPCLRTRIIWTRLAGRRAGIFDRARPQGLPETSKIPRGHISNMSAGLRLIFLEGL